MSNTRKYIFFIAGAISMLTMTLSSYGIATVTPVLLQQMNAMEYYTLTSLMASIGMLLFLPIVGKLVDTIGRKPLLIIGGGITLVSSLAAGFATNFIVFLVMRALITVGCACLTPLPSSTLPFLFDRKELPKLYGIQGAFLALGTFFGSTIAGFCSDIGAAWLAVAYPGVIAAIASAAMYVCCPKVPSRPRQKLDAPGIVLMFLMVGSVMYVSSFGRIEGWGSPIILGMLAVLIVSILLFIKVENKVSDPLINLNLFKNPVFTGAILCTFFLTWYQSSMRVYVPLAIQNVMGMSAAASGSVLLPRSILNVILPTFCGAWIAKNQSARCWQGLMLAGLTIAIGNIMISFISPQTTLLVFFVGLGLTGASESFKQAALNPMVQAGLTAENMGSGMSLNAMMGSLGSAISTCVFGIVHSAIAPDTSVIPDLAAASNAVFMVATLSGLVVMLLSFTLLRPKKTAEAA